MRRIAAILPLLVLPSLLEAEETTRVAWQPVMKYLLRKNVQPKARGSQEAIPINPFVSYTHIGTDFGFHGPGERYLSWDNGRLSADLETPTEWAGMWHCLEGLARENGRTMNFAKPYGAAIADRWQPRVSSLMVEAQGCGTLKLELKSNDQRRLWEKSLAIDSPKPGPIQMPVSPQNVPDAKFLNWTAEPGASLTFSGLSLGFELPEGSSERQLLLSSYAKLLRCWTESTGLVRDRAHIEEGAFDSMPASACFGLATAVMAHPSVGMVDPVFARQALRRLHTTVQAIPRAKGLLPHFVKRVDGQLRIHPGTEYSTVDTAIYLQSILLAASILQEPDVVDGIRKMLREVQVEGLRLGDGAISHGLKDDGTTLLPFAWRDWGGETALVLLMARMAGDGNGSVVMAKDGRIWQGTGFIAEIQSLFHPDFSSSTPDAVSGVNWLAAREAMLNAQKGYFPKQLPGSFAARVGLYGLSAGEGAYGASYHVGGVDLPDQQVVHPHYIALSAALEKDHDALKGLLHRLQHAGWYTPFGFVENIPVDGNRHLPMIGGLNACFETLGAYHLVAKVEQAENVIYKASRDDKEIREAMRLFFPHSVALAE